jgi:hypothetical protein
MPCSWRFAGPLITLIGALFAGALGSCGDDPPAAAKAPMDSHAIKANRRELSMRPEGSRVVVFVLTDGAGRPVRNRVIRFDIVEGKPEGAVLSLDTGVTNALGEVVLQVIAGGATNFYVRASAQNAGSVQVKVYVDLKKRGPVELAPELPPELDAEVDAISVVLIQGHPCAGLVTSPATEWIRVARGQTAIYDAVSAEETHAVLGQGVDATGRLRVQGCVDLPGAVVLEEETIRVPVPLDSLRPSPLGRYQASSLLQFPTVLPKASTAMVAAWSELAACPFDPGRLWLDCTVDALSDSESDPLDCVPSVSDDAFFDGRLAARRGLLTRTTPNSRCRGAEDAARRNSLENQIDGMFANQNPQLIESLRALAQDMDSIARNVELQSTMEVSPTSLVNRFQVDHLLSVVVLGEQKTPVDLRELGLPVRAARFVPMTSTGKKATFQAHGFTLRLGSAMRIAVERGVLPRRRFSSDIAAFATEVFASATYLDRGTKLSGCVALGALVCPLVGGVEGCLTKPCRDGVAALGRQLQGAFSRLDGTDLDLVLEAGEAPLYDSNGDGKVDTFGKVSFNESPGLWAGRLRTLDEEVQFFIQFTADRER